MMLRRRVCEGKHKTSLVFVGDGEWELDTEVLVLPEAELEAQLAAAREEVNRLVEGALNALGTGSYVEACLTPSGGVNIYGRRGDARKSVSTEPNFTAAARALLAAVQPPAPEPCPHTGAEWRHGIVGGKWWWVRPTGETTHAPPNGTCEDCGEDMPPKPVAAMTDEEVEVEVDGRVEKPCRTWSRTPTLWRAREDTPAVRQQGEGATGAAARRDLLTKLREEAARDGS